VEDEGLFPAEEERLEPGRGLLFLEPGDRFDAEKSGFFAAEAREGPVFADPTGFRFGVRIGTRVLLDLQGDVADAAPGPQDERVGALPDRRRDGAPAARVDGVSFGIVRQDDSPRTRGKRTW
jgi:hypothetical protein